MFIALDENGKKINIDNADPSRNYLCPVCMQSLTIKAENSPNVRTHFAHKRKCVDTWIHDMSEWHYSWQCCFPEECREVVVEKDGIKHRADVLIGNYVIEFQNSRISGDEIRERNIFYTGCGKVVIWVFNANGKVKNFYETNGCIDPARADKLEWKRVRKEFENQNLDRVSYFIEYNTQISTDQPQKTNIMLYLRNLHPKQIYYLSTSFPEGKYLLYHYLTRDNFVASFLPVNNQQLTAFQIIEMSIQFNNLRKAHSRENYVIPYQKSRRRFRF